VFSLEEIIEMPPFSLAAPERSALLVRGLNHLTGLHRRRCERYNRIVDVVGAGATSEAARVEDVPFVPVRLFKTHELRSVEPGEVVKTMTSSGTGGQVSRIFLDRETAANQTKVLSKLMGTLIGKKRLPMLIVDSRAAIKDRNLFSARGAGILGFSMFGYDVEYALDEKMELDLPRVRAFLARHPNEPILLFGFTFMIWLHLCEVLERTGERLDISRGIMVHGGGWKKLVDRAITNDGFKRKLRELTGIQQVINYYGMVEQTGSIFLECEHGRLHSSIFSDIVVRKPADFTPCKVNEVGLVQLLSLLPSSYPGHSILSEDEGRILGEDDCPCGRKGKYFEILGRVKNAEVRGCSDTYVSGN
jgi:hypothetical protein